MLNKIKEINEQVSENLAGKVVKGTEDVIEQNHTESNEEYESYASADSLDEFMKLLEEDKHQPVGLVILESLGLCGPLLWLIYNCMTGAWNKLILNIPLAIVGAILFVIVWKDYFKKSHENKILQKEENKGSLLLFLLIIIGIAFMLGMFAALSGVQECIYATKGWLFYATSNLSIWITIILGIALIIVFISVFLQKFSKNSAWKLVDAEFIKKHWKIAIIIVAISFYIAITGVTIVTEDKIIYHSWLHPMGVTYTYEDVTKIKAGYKSGIGSSKGDFYYKVCFDGQWISFGETTPNEAIKRYNDTYIEIEDFDEKLMKYHPEKISSHKNETYADLEQIYIDRFNRIIDKK